MSIDSNDAGFAWNHAPRPRPMVEGDYVQPEEHDIERRDDVDPCPFCGCQPAYLRGGLQYDDYWSFVVVCDQCGAEGPGLAKDNRDDAFMVGMVMWNRRK